LRTKTGLEKAGKMDPEKENLIAASMHCFKIISNSIFFIFIERYLKSQYWSRDDEQNKSVPVKGVF